MKAIFANNENGLIFGMFGLFLRGFLHKITIKCFQVRF